MTKEQLKQEFLAELASEDSEYHDSIESFVDFIITKLNQK